MQVLVNGSRQDISELQRLHAEATLSPKKFFQLFVIWTLWAILLKLHRTQP